MDQATRLARRDQFLSGLGRPPKIMGILNVTPDSFSDGGRHDRLDAALAHAQAMAAEGAAVIDIGGESTRPGANPVSDAEELRRVLPVVDAVVGALALPVSIDTYKASVARQAAERGASIINDIWGLQGDPMMATVAAETGSAVIAMHNRAAIDPGLDILDELLRFFDRSMTLARHAGVPEAHMILDPGIGFGKTLEQNVAAIAGLGRLAALGRPILLGVSRKSFIARIHGNAAQDRLPGTIAANLHGVQQGAAIIRVHDVGAHAQALAVLAAVQGAYRPG